jgi:hypothetical protein
MILRERQFWKVPRLAVNMRPSLYITYMQGRIYVGSINFRDELHNGCHPTQTLRRLHYLSWTLQYSQHWTTDMLHRGEIRRNSWTRRDSQCHHTLVALSAHYALTGPSWPHCLISTATRTSDIPRHIAPCAERLLRTLTDNIAFRTELCLTDSNSQTW